jgi:putative phage-type endonuclease
MSTQVKPEFTREGWLEQRRTGIGGSDVAALLGKDPFGGTPASLYDDKLGLVPDEPPTPVMEAGRILEPTVAALYSEATERKIRNQPMRRHREHPHMVGNIDRQILNDPRGPGVLEIKCPGLKVFADTKAYGLGVAYILQMQHYLEVFGYAWGSFAVFGRERWSLLHFDVERDTDVGAFLVEEEGKFWRAVQNRERPSEVAPELPDLPEVSGEVVVRSDPEWLVAVAALAEAKNLSKTAGELETVAKEAVKELMGGFGIQEGGGYRFYHNERAGRAMHAQTVKAIEKLRPLDPTKVVDAIVMGLGDAGKDIISQGYDVRAGVADWIVNCAMDLDLLKKVGKPFPHFQGFPLKAEAVTE